MKMPKYLAAATILAICMGAFVTRANADEESGGRLRATLKKDSTKPPPIPLLLPVHFGQPSAMIRPPSLLNSIILALLLIPCSPISTWARKTSREEL